MKKAIILILLISSSAYSDDDWKCPGVYKRNDGPNIVFFDLNSFIIKSSQALKLDKLTVEIKKRQENKIVITGHTDQRGLRKYNFTLGYKRANSVKEYLIKSGLNTSIRIQSMGEDMPLTYIYNLDCLTVNARAEVTFE